MSIKILPPHFANQIAAGEVVERPASVVKELMENSLDAGATRINIDIERGGAKLIRISDNGGGIGKAELPLALARHATSKISSLDELEAVLSMGFRGEALASISSVSRLTLTSRTAEQPEAWQAYTEGRDLVVTVKPAAHPVGSTVDVLDLFYNTPARRKFMRTEKTEFSRIDEVVRRIALARFDVAINLQHNGKLVRQYRAVQERSQHERRLASVCGTTFLQHARAIFWQHSDLTIRGWVVNPSSPHTLREIQYCYVNRRIMRDRLISHAIRQAYQELLKSEQQPAYVLYLELDPHQVDVNVHPAKHEVRFHQARLVHDAIYQAVANVLQPASELTDSISEVEMPRWQPENRTAGGHKYPQPTVASRITSARSPHESYYAGRTDQKQQGELELYRHLLQPAENANNPSIAPSLPVTSTKAMPTPIADPLGSSCHSFGRVLTIYPPCYALIESHHGKVSLLSLPVAEHWLKQAQLTPQAENLRPQPLLIPLKLVLNETEIAAFTHHQKLLISLGIELAINHDNATLRAVPLPLRHQQNLQKLIPEMLGYLSGHQEMSAGTLAAWIAHHLCCEREVWNISQAIQLLTDVERLCPHLVSSSPRELIQPINLQTALAALKHD